MLLSSLDTGIVFYHGFMSSLRRNTLIAVNLILWLGLMVGCVGFGQIPASQDQFATGKEREAATTIPLGTGSASSTTTYSHTSPPSFGILAVIPGSSGSTSDPVAVAAVADSGARYMRVSLDWAISEPQAGQLSFDTANDRRIRRIERAGLRLFPTLYVGRGWMNGNPPSNREGGSRSYPPNDLTLVWNEQYGYSRGYYNFVYQFFSHYQGHFDFVAIENEAHSKIFWGGTANEYVRLIKTAYKAIKAADPAVTVVDSGFVSIVLGLCIADDYLKSNLMTKEEVESFAVAYYSTETAKIQIRSTSDLYQALNFPRIQEQCQRITYMIDNMDGAVDALNFHFYEDYRTMHFITDWIRYRTDRAGYSPGLVTNELGQRGPNKIFAESDLHAQEVFKKLVTSLSLGLEVVVWFSADTIDTGALSPDKVGLFVSGGGKRSAAQTLKLIAQKIGTEYRFKTSLASGPSLFHYVFEDSDGAPKLEVIWTEDGGETITLSAPTGISQAIITDYSGRHQVLVVNGDSVPLNLSDAPVFVEWKE